VRSPCRGDGTVYGAANEAGLLEASREEHAVNAEAAESIEFLFFPTKIRIGDDCQVGIPPAQLSDLDDRTFTVRVIGIHDDPVYSPLGEHRVQITPRDHGLNAVMPKQRSRQPGCRARIRL
jgi:hypothetical protein